MEQLQKTLKNAQAAYDEAVAARLAAEDNEASAMARFASDMSESNHKGVVKCEEVAANARRIEKALSLRRDQAQADIKKAEGALKDARIAELRGSASFASLLESCESEIREMLLLDEKARPLIQRMREKARVACANREELIRLEVEHTGKSLHHASMRNPNITLADVANACSVIVTEGRKLAGAQRDTLESFVFTATYDGHLQNVNRADITAFSERVLAPSEVVK